MSGNTNNMTQRCFIIAILQSSSPKYLETKNPTKQQGELIN